MPGSTLIVIAGPTASGKTALSIKLAKALEAEIFSADARQFYRGMDIGTAKPTSEQLQAVKHHFIDVLNVEDDYNAGNFETDALEQLSTYFQTQDVAFLVGGSGLYINAVTEGFDDLPTTPPELRAAFNQRFEELGLEGFQKALKEKDPLYYAQVDVHNKQRLQRALEAIELTGKPFSELRKNQASKRPFHIINVLIQPPREVLYDRINQRVEKMIEQGLLKEAEAFYPKKHLNALQTVGYQEIFDMLDGKYTKDEAIEKIKQHTRNYAKRQTTWFKKQDDYHEFTSNDIEPVLRHLKERMNV